MSARTPRAATGRRVVDGAWTDDVTAAARAAHAAGDRVDHDAGMRQARTALSAGRAGRRWGQDRRWLFDEDMDAAADAVLARMPRPEPELVEGLARATSRTYDEVVARWRHWHPKAES